MVIISGFSFNCLRFFKSSSQGYSYVKYLFSHVVLPSCILVYFDVNVCYNIY
jgi:hypothetical protein